MGRKDYCSPEYYAGLLRDYCLRNPVPGHGFFVSNVRHSDGVVMFETFGCEFILEFRKSNGRTVSHLEVQSGEETFSDERTFRPKRSSSGRVSEVTYDTLFRNFVVPLLKKATRR